MRIGIDARFYNKKTGGIGRQIKELLKNSIIIDKKNTYVVFLLEKDLKDFEEKAPNIEIVISEAPYYSLKEHYLLPREIRGAKLDFMHFLNFNVPFNCSVPYVVTIHDLTLLFFPGRKKKLFIHRLAYRMVMNRAVRKAKLVHTVSEHTKKDLINIFKISQDKIFTVYPGISKEFKKVEDKGKIKRVQQKFDIKEPYFMFHGAWQVHKNIMKMIQGFVEFIKLNKANQKYQLLICSDPGTEYLQVKNEIHNLKLDKNIVITPSFVNDEELTALLTGCKLYIFPSLYEGFGLTPLEAMTCGAPVISSNRSCIPEVLGDAAYYFNPRNEKEIARAIQVVISNPKLQEELKNKGFKRIKKYSWEEYTKSIHRLYKKF